MRVDKILGTPPTQMTIEVNVFINVSDCDLKMFNQLVFTVNVPLNVPISAVVILPSITREYD